MDVSAGDAVRLVAEQAGDGRLIVPEIGGLTGCIGRPRRSMLADRVGALAALPGAVHNDVGDDLPSCRRAPGHPLSLDGTGEQSRLPRSTDDIKPVRSYPLLAATRVAPDPAQSPPAAISTASAKRGRPEC